MIGNDIGCFKRIESGGGGNQADFVGGCKHASFSLVLQQRRAGVVFNMNTRRPGRLLVR